MPIQVFAQKVCYNMSCGLVSEDAIRNNLRNHFGSMVEESFPTSSTMANKNKKKKKTEAVSAAGTTDGTAEKTEAVSAAGTAGQVLVAQQVGHRLAAVAAVAASVGSGGPRWAAGLL